MFKRILSLACALALLCAFAGSVFAAEDADGADALELPAVVTAMQQDSSGADADAALEALDALEEADEPAAKEDEGTLAALFAAFREEYGLTEDNFAVSYYDTVTGERYDWNETHMMVAASTYKLPLNLYYYEMENAGEIAPDALITGGGATLDWCHYLSIVESNNEISHALLYRIGTFRDYKIALRKYFTMTDDEIDEKYYQNNFFCTRMMMDTLEYVYANAEEFPELLDYMKQSLPKDGYFKKYVTDVDVAHKYGSFEGAENDVGIFYTERPFLLAVYTQYAGVEIVSLAAQLAYSYNVEQTRLANEAARQAELDAALAQFEQEKEIRLLEAEQRAAEVQEAQRQEREAALAAQKAQALAAQKAREAEEAEEEAKTAASSLQFSAENFEWWMLPVAAGVALVGGGGGILIWRTSRVKFQPEEPEEADKEPDKAAEETPANP